MYPMISCCGLEIIIGSCHPSAVTVLLTCVVVNSTQSFCLLELPLDFPIVIHYGQNVCKYSKSVFAFVL